MKKLKEEFKYDKKGITLIALVITIIVLLILAGVTIATLTGDNGILTRANEAKEETKAGEDIEKIKLAISEAQMGENGYQELTTENLGSELIKDGTNAIVSDNEDGTKHILFLDEKKEYSLDNNGNIQDLNIDFNTKYVAPASQDEERNNGVIGIGTDGNPVDMDLWCWAYDEKTNGYALNTEEELENTAYNTGYLGNFVEGRIQGSIPAYIKEEGKDWIAVTDLESLFNNCEELVYPPKLPNTAINMFATFAGNTNLVEAPSIPRNVEKMEYCFIRCSSLKKTPILPEGLTNLSATFSSCFEIEEISNLPESLVDMSNAFSYTKIKISPDIPDNVITLENTFLCCKELEKAPKIGKNVKNMTSTFNACSKLKGNIDIYSPIVSVADAIVWDVPNNITIRVIQNSETEMSIRNSTSDQTYYSKVTTSYL